MYNLHCHSLLSDGVLLPSEVAARYLDKGFKVIAITDHCDYSNIKHVIKSILEFTRHWPKDCGIKVLPGVELTHIQPKQFKPLVKYCRGKGIKVIVGHGESPVEPVVKGTNRAALEAGVDILAHPGKISDADVLLAKKKGIFLEITTRRGHSNTNKHVADRACKLGAKLVISTDSHHPEDIITPDQMAKVAVKVGLSTNQITQNRRILEYFLRKI
jgi:histidinol phosphatase-like PHP family hydrolase